jgi:hypothetical protein
MISKELGNINSWISSLELEIKKLEYFIDNPFNHNYSIKNVHIEKAKDNLNDYRRKWLEANRIKDELIKKNETTH